LSSQKSDAHVLDRQALLRGWSSAGTPQCGGPARGVVSRGRRPDRLVLPPAAPWRQEERLDSMSTRTQIGVTSTPAKVFLPRRRTSQEPPTRSLPAGTSSGSSTRWLLR